MKSSRTDWNAETALIRVALRRSVFCTRLRPADTRNCVMWCATGSIGHFQWNETIKSICTALKRGLFSSIACAISLAPDTTLHSTFFAEMYKRPSRAALPSSDGS